MCVCQVNSILFNTYIQDHCVTFHRHRDVEVIIHRLRALTFYLFKLICSKKN